MLIFDEVNKIISPVYLVGGCVRDILMENTPKDFDFCTPLTPDEIENRIKSAGRHAYNIGKRFGTVGVKINGQMVEITTFRAEEYDSGCRKPYVQFIKDLESDLSRRDFTINAMAMTKDGETIDYFNGKEDLSNKLIRCVGKPRDRFKEDPLRMLRAARFSAQLGFNIEEKTLDTITEMNYKILEVSRERWVLELDKLLMSNDVMWGLDVLASTKLLNYMIPELSLQVGYNQNNPHHSKDLWTHTCFVVKQVEKDINLKWAALLHDIGKPFVRHDNNKGYSNYIRHDLLGKELVIKLAYYLKWSNERREIIADLVLNHMMENSPIKEADEKSK